MDFHSTKLNHLLVLIKPNPNLTGVK